MNIQMINSSVSMSELQKKVDTLSHNIANLSTPGYKRREAVFEDTLTQTIKNQHHAQKEMARATPYGLRLGHGSKLAQTTLRTDQGAAQATERPLDFMIEGEGVWFQTRRIAGEGANQQQESLYTRDGSFHLLPFQDAAGESRLRLITGQGYAVLNALGNPIEIDPDYDSIVMNPDEGTLQVYYPGQALPVEHQLNLVRVHRPDLFEAVGDNHFRFREEPPQGILRQLDLNGADRGLVQVRQGALEMSNVDLTTEMTELMATQRFMQFQARSIAIADDMMGLANSIRG